MPFVQRTVQPKFICRKAKRHDEASTSRSLDSLDADLDTVTNNTLCNALKQLASLVFHANDIFSDLGAELQLINDRAKKLKERVNIVDDRIQTYDPKKVQVPESDISTFASITEHFKLRQEFQTELFKQATRTRAIEKLYEDAAKTPVTAIRQLDRWREDGHRSSRIFLCTPTLSDKRKKIGENIEIETRKPAAQSHLRKWTSEEALGDVTSLPNCSHRINASTTLLLDQDQIDFMHGGVAPPDAVVSDDEGIDYKLPSPEEQLMVVANRFPAEVIKVDTSGKQFMRMSAQRRSLLHIELQTQAGTSQDNAEGEETSARRKPRRGRHKRRNTISGTDQKEIENAVNSRDETVAQSDDQPFVEFTDYATVTRSKSSDLLRQKKSPTNSDSKKSHFNSLKQWGINRLKMINKSFESKFQSNETISNSTLSIKYDDQFFNDDMVTVKRRKGYEKDKKSDTSIPITTRITGAMAVKLRDSAAQKRQRRSGGQDLGHEPHSSSGNWSASSESGRASAGSEIASTAPKSTTSNGTNTSVSNTSIPNMVPNIVPSSVTSRRKFGAVGTSNCSSVTSEETMSPDHDLHSDDGTSSVYSCDTEGYYTSFHMDSGLKTLKEEGDSMPCTPLQSTSALTNSAENEYELFGKGSTSTTTSSAGTVCTTLLLDDVQKHYSSLNRSGSICGMSGNMSGNMSVSAPAVPERISSLPRIVDSIRKVHYYSLKERKTPRETIVKETEVNDDPQKRPESPDSGHNTSSSPIESVNSPNDPKSCSEFECSESSDLEGLDRMERIRTKTIINSSRIPSMCVITPPHSDDEYGEEKKSQEKSQKLGIVKVLPESTDENRNIRKWEPKIQEIQPQQNSPITVTKQIIRQKLQPLIFATEKFLGKPTQKIVTPQNEDDYGDYVTLKDVRNTDQNRFNRPTNENNDIAQKNLDSLLSGKIKEYISLNELPCNVSTLTTPTFIDSTSNSSLERMKRTGARVILDAEGRVVYSSDSLKRQKQPSSFEPGPCVKLGTTNSPLTHRKLTVRPIAPSTRDRSPKKIIRPKSKEEDVVEGTSVPARNDSGVRIGARVNVQSCVGHMIGSSDVEEVVERNPKQSGNLSINRNVNKDQKSINYVQGPTNQSQRLICKTDSEEESARLRYNPNNIYKTLPARRPPDHKQMISTRARTPDGKQTDQPPVLQRISIQTFGSQSAISKTPQFSSFPNPIVQNLKSSQQNIQGSQQNIQGSQQNIQRHGIDEVESPFYDFPSSQPIGSPPQNLQKPFVLKQEHFNPNPQYYSSPRVQDGSIPIPISVPSFSPIRPQTCQSPSNLTSSPLSFSSPLSQKKSNMTQEELYAVIHKSKKKFNLSKPEIVPTPPNLYTSIPERSRQSWSPSAVETGQLLPNNPNSPRSRQSWDLHSDPQKLASQGRPAAKKITSTMDFKRLLLAKSSRGNGRKSAVEQLKLTKLPGAVSKSPINYGKPAPPVILDLSQSPRNLQGRKFYGRGSSDSPRHGSGQRVAPKIMSPKSAWRFHSPRTDVLSSTILEDCREDEVSPGSSLEKTNSISPIDKSAHSPNQSEAGTTSTPSFTQFRDTIRVCSSRRQLQLDKVEMPSESPSHDYNANVQTNEVDGKVVQENELAGSTRAAFLKAQRERFLFGDLDNNNSSPTSSPDTENARKETLETDL